MVFILCNYKLFSLSWWKGFQFWKNLDLKGETKSTYFLRSNAVLNVLATLNKNNDGCKIGCRSLKSQTLVKSETFSRELL